MPRTTSVATIGAPADTNHLLHLLADSREQILDDGEAEVCLASRTFRRRQFLEDISSQPQTERVRRLCAALLVMHSPTDEIVGIANAKQIFQAARHPKSFLSRPWLRWRPTARPRHRTYGGRRRLLAVTVVAVIL